MIYSNALKIIAAGLILIMTVSCDNLLDTGGETEPPIDWDDGHGIAEAEDGHLSGEEIEKWKKSARELAIRTVRAEDSTRTDIPDDLVSMYYNGLIHVVNSGTEKAREVTEVYGIEARPEFMHGEVLVFPDTVAAASWIGAWRAGETETGRESVDELTAKYNLNLSSFSEKSEQPYASAKLTTDNLLNIPAVAVKFEVIEEISMSEPNFLAGDGNNISTEIRDTHVNFRYELKWGDCPAKCINTHYWEFNVTSEGSVQFLGEGGDDIPDELPGKDSTEH